MSKENKPKVSLAKMTYGNMRRANDSLYITDYPNTEKQELINIKTGKVMQEVYSSTYLSNSYSVNKINAKPIYKHIENVKRLKGGLVLTTPRPYVNEYVARIYNEDGNCIFILKDTREAGEFSKLIVNNNVLIILRDSKRTDHVIVYNKNKKEITENYIGVDKLYYDKNSICIRQLTLDGKFIIHRYEMES